jgi:hypothetical protein
MDEAARPRRGAPATKPPEAEHGRGGAPRWRAPDRPSRLTSGAPGTDADVGGARVRYKGAWARAPCGFISISMAEAGKLAEGQEVS